MNAPRTRSIGPFLGMNNRLPDYKLQAFDRGRPIGHYQRNVVNADYTDAQTLQRRPGYTRLVEGLGYHSLWADDSGAFCVQSERLYAVSSGLVLTEIRDGLTPGLQVSYARLSNVVYWSNGVMIERIIGGVSKPVALPLINPEPVISVSSGGALPGGRYLITFTRRDANHEESGPTTLVVLEVPDNGRIDVSNIDAGDDAISIYLSPVNGDELYRADILPAGTTAWSAPVTPLAAGRLLTRHMRPMPPGNIVRVYNGRLLVASGNLLYYSEPYAPGMHDAGRGYIPFPALITIVAPCVNGVYVVADKTYWLFGGDIDKAEMVERLPYGAVARTDVIDLKTRSVWWFSTRGMVLGNAQGEVRNLQEEDVAVDTANTGALYHREQDGMRQIVASLFGAEPSRAAATTFMEAEVIRKENML